MAMVARGAATAPSAVLRRPIRQHVFLATLAIQTRSAHRKTKGRQIALPPRRLERMTYFRLVIAVRSAESLTMPAAPHQFEPNPLGLIAVTKPGLELVVL
jgi:hypothetical protein